MIPGSGGWGGTVREWRDEVIPLPDVVGDVRFRFRFVSNFSGSDGIFDGWFIDAVSVHTWPRTHGGVVETEEEPDGLKVRLRIGTLFPESVPGSAALEMARGGDERTLLTTSWGPDEATAEGDFELLPLAAGETVCFWIRWNGGERAPAAPLVLTNPLSGGPLLAGTPGLVRAGESAEIRFRVPGTEPVPVSLRLFDLRGSLVATLLEGERHPGAHREPWVNRGETGRTLPRGGVLSSRPRGGSVPRRDVWFCFPERFRPDSRYRG